MLTVSLSVYRHCCEWQHRQWLCHRSGQRKPWGLSGSRTCRDQTKKDLWVWKPVLGMTTIWLDQIINGCLCNVMTGIGKHCQTSPELSTHDHCWVSRPCKNWDIFYFILYYIIYVLYHTATWGKGGRWKAQLYKIVKWPQAGMNDDGVSIQLTGSGFGWDPAASIPIECSLKTCYKFWAVHCTPVQ